MIDLYCERIDPGLWSEPINASTNLAFFVAAYAVWNLAHRLRAQSAAIWLLLSLIIAIGIGSGLFHTFATPWARLLDALPILLFELSYLWLYSRKIIELKRSNAWGGLAGFLIASHFGRKFPRILNGSLIYGPALVFIWGLGLYHCRTRRHARFDLLSGAGVFSVSLFFRTIDNAICPSIPIGTHFLWHLLLPVVLFLFVRGLLLNGPTTPGTT